MPLVWWLGYREIPTRAALIALAFITATCLVLARSWRPDPGPVRRVLHSVALTVIGLVAAVPGWFFGPHGGFEALIAVILVLVGMLSGGIRGRLPAVAGW